jgi:hypothetical protein
MPDYAQYRTNSNFQLIITNKEAVVVSRVSTLEEVRVNFQTNSLTNNNVKPKQVILKMMEVVLLGVLNHLKMPRGHTSAEMAITIRVVVNPNTNRLSSIMKTIRILSLMGLVSRRGVVSSRFSFRGLERTRVSCLTRGWRWTGLIWLKNVIGWESHLAASTLKTYRTCLNNLRKSKLRSRQKVVSLLPPLVKVHNNRLR